MNLLVLEVPIHKTNTCLYYTVILDPCRLSNYHHSIYLPEKTVILNNAHELLKMDLNDKKINLLFTQKKVMKHYQQLRINKKVKTGLLKKHEIINELLNKTPIYYDKDSIKQSLWLLNLTKTVSNYESLIPQSMMNNLKKLKQGLNNIKPINSTLGFAKINNGLIYQGPKTLDVKKKTRIKNFPDKCRYEFKNNFYTLGKLGQISLQLRDLWTH